MPRHGGLPSRLTPHSVLASAPNQRSATWPCAPPASASWAEQVDAIHPEPIPPKDDHQNLRPSSQSHISRCAHDLRHSSSGGGLPADVNPPTAPTSSSTCLMHTDRSDGMPTTKVPRPSSPAASPPTEPTGIRSRATEDANIFACGANPRRFAIGCSAGWSLRSRPQRDARDGLVFRSQRFRPSGRRRP